MIVWGSKTSLLRLGSGGTHWCATCAAPRAFQLALRYACFTLYFVFGVVTSKQYLMLCSICGTAWCVAPPQVQPPVKAGLSIPYLDRFGLMTFGAAAAALVLVSTVAGSLSR